MNIAELTKSRARTPLDFDAINSAARTCFPSLLRKWLPEGKLIGREYVALNPRRADRHLGSFRINATSGAWGDFATEDRGSDPISLAAYLSGLSQYEAAAELAAQLGINAENPNK